MRHRLFIPIALAGAALLLLISACGGPAARVSGDGIAIDFDDNMHSQVTAMVDGRSVTMGGMSASEVLEVDGNTLADFALDRQESRAINDAIGSGTETVLSGTNGTVRKTVTVRVYDAFPAMAAYDVTWRNDGDAPLTVTAWSNNRYTIDAESGAGTPAFWAYQGASYTTRPDWVQPIDNGYSQENYMGMNHTDYGSGTPVVDVWRRDVGIAVGHLDMDPRLVSIPLSMEGNRATLGVRKAGERTIEPGGELTTLTTFVAVHEGDHFNALSMYRDFMVAQGIELAAYPESTYEPIWCAWGYERNYTHEQVVNTLPKVKELGYEWAVLDDGWQTAEGDWYLHPQKYPRGDRDMKRFTDDIRKAGLRPKLWWAPLAVDPGTDLIRDHEDWLLINKDGEKQDIEWWNAYYLCPAYPPVVEFHTNLVRTMMEKWGYDGLKIDGQHLNGAPPCYNPAHNHADPEESFRAVPDFFKAIYETSLSIVPDAVVEICPCGATYAFHMVPYMNQPVASDPTSSFQIRLKGKTLKALMGVDAPYYGDHVELSDGRNDFASSVGIGGVIGTKFTWPVGAKPDSEIDLTEEREAHFQKWIDVYLEKMLSSGTYRGELYDIGFDAPESHAVEKDGVMHYAFYADEFDGNVELRGLKTGTYKIRDYVNGADLGTVTGPTGTLRVSFSDFLLVEAVAE